MSMIDNPFALCLLFGSQPVERELTSLDHTLSLPVETLTKIFAYFTNKSSLLVVCRRWRQIIFQSRPKHVVVAHDIIYQMQNHLNFGDGFYLNLVDGFFGGMRLKIFTVRFQESKPIIRMVDFNDNLIKHYETGHVSCDGGVTWKLHHIYVSNLSSLMIFYDHPQLFSELGHPDVVIGPFIKRSTLIPFLKNRVHVSHIHKGIKVISNHGHSLTHEEWKNKDRIMSKIEQWVNNYSHLLFQGSSVSEKGFEKSLIGYVKREMGLSYRADSFPS